MNRVSTRRTGRVADAALGRREGVHPRGSGVARAPDGAAVRGVTGIRLADGTRSVGNRRRWLGSVAAGVASWAFIGHAWGFAAAVPCAAAAYLILGQVERAGAAAAGSRTAADLPYAADLLAAVLAAGLPTQRAAEIVGDAVGGPVGDRLGRVARSLALGVDPSHAWAAIGDLPGGWRLASAAVRSAEHGAALACACARLAEELRGARALEAETAARRAGVLLVLPLGLCFLPAFVFAGIVPVVVAVFSDVFR